MTCNSFSDISFEFNSDSGKTYLEIRPRSMQFDRTRGEFDYCKAEFDQEAADEITPHLDDGDSFLRQPLPVVLKIQGEPVYRLLWVPDGARITDNSVHIEFHDPQKYLTRGVVDWRRETVEIREAYEYVFEQRDQNGPELFSDIKFTIPEQAYDELVAIENQDGSRRDKVSRMYREAQAEDEWDNENTHKYIEEQNVSNLIRGHSAIDFNKISPWECITKLNELFGVRTWAGSDGNLWVGSRKATGYGHIVTPDDSRVWKLSDYNINAPRDPVTRTVVRGGWADDPQQTYYDQAAQMITQLNDGTKDFRIEAVASRDDILFGQEVVIEVGAKRDALEEIAKAKMMQKEREQQSGYLEIDPQLSGTQHSDPKYASVGDTVMTVPPQGDGDCSGNIQEELFDVVGVQHELSESGTWNLRLDVAKQLDGPLHPDQIETRIRYYDPHEQEIVEEDQYSAQKEERNGQFWNHLF